MNIVCFVFPDYLKLCLCDLDFSSPSFYLKFIHSLLYGSVKELLAILTLLNTLNRDP